MTKGMLALEDGRIFYGLSFGKIGVAEGEVVFNTSMTGYQEILTDPSYHGQIVTMTYPLIGNYGTNNEDLESASPQVEGFVVREYCPYPSNWRNSQSLRDYLVENNIVALSEIDTRALTKHIRLAGAMRAVIAAGDHDPKKLVAQAQASPGLVGRDLVCEVTSKKTYDWTDPCAWKKPETGKPCKVVAFDFGIKYNILRYLVSFGCKVKVVPASTKAEEILAENPDGIFLSNGPGDPEGVMYAVEEIRKLLGKKPIFGICLGHQLLALALNGKTYKLKFGHHGANHPVKDLTTGKVEITTQNHGFCVDMDSLPSSEIEVTHMNLNDNTVEGFRHKSIPAFCVQYHPEAGPGPHDSEYLFGSFMEMIKAYAQTH
ncbi:MAG: glutamine-hydrolyzing carbamoyl-phosphate synthase small subunit [Planctomycetes bacterium]|nr:glutamine-hydrolyzing carbamoyl-phosphate synthase small subunit [Planctomycetota bacterium]